MSIIDFHSHVLPGIDDGSRDVETSVAILREAARQGVDCMVATPHFYASRDRVGAFLERRQASLEKLNTYLQPDFPQIVVGAEVAYFNGCSEAERLEDLTIGDSRLLLLELPFDVWSRKIVDEVEALIEERSFRVVTAHLERYLSIKENQKELQRLLELPIIVQVNAGSFSDWKRKGKTLRLLKGIPHFVLGSDCHGMNRRPPNLSDGRDVILKKLGQKQIEKMDQLSESLLAGEVPLFS